MTDPSHAVFLSYASQDAPAARKICDALRAGGIEVWFDQSELRGGDSWDQKIRQEIRDCALFMPLISAHSDARREGYFRREWRMAVDRTADMSDRLAFLVPVVIDDTSDSGADVPDRFRQMHWTRLPGGETPPGFVERIKRLLSPELSQEPTGTVPAIAPRILAAPTVPNPVPPFWRAKSARLATLAAVGVALAAAATYITVEKPWVAKSVAFAPPRHSIAVLPFVNMSGDKEQDYFSDGLTEELLNSLTEVNELQVAARTSAFSFKGTNTDIGTIARKLNVGAVLEGSVRRSGNTVRITTQLINAVTGFHLWSHTYDRDLGDVLKLETDIATAVASALKVALLGDVAAKVELGGTRNPAAFDAYLRGAKTYTSMHEANELPTAIAEYTQAVRLDPHYALAFAARSIALTLYGAEAAPEATVREHFDKAQEDARSALALAPDLAQAQLALAYVSGVGNLDFTQASAAYDRALALAPGNAEVLRQSGVFAAWMGHFNAALAAARRAVVLDPLARESHSRLGEVLYFSRRYEQAIAAYGEVISLEPDYKPTYGYRGLAYYGLGDLQRARASCETKSDYWVNQLCLAVVYDKLGQRADSEAQLSKLKAAMSGAAAYQYATIYAQWGDRAQALEWLETALQLRDPGLEFLKTDPLMDPLRQEPRFQAIVRQLKFPE